MGGPDLEIAPATASLSTSPAAAAIHAPIAVIRDDFSSRPRLLHHLCHRSARCRATAEVFFDTLSEEALAAERAHDADVAKQQAAKHSRRLRAHVPAVRVPAPPVRPAAGQAEPKVGPPWLELDVATTKKLHDPLGLLMVRPALELDPVDGVALHPPLL